MTIAAGARVAASKQMKAAIRLTRKTYTFWAERHLNEDREPSSPNRFSLGRGPL